MDMTLEVVTVPVRDTDRAKDFYADKLGFNVDMDVKVDGGVRFVQLTPPGSNCSIHLAEGASVMEPGTLKGLILVVDDARKARASLEEKGVRLSDVEEQPWGRHVYFSDPDGNSWTLQESFARNQRKAAAIQAQQ
jgi:catechol 2,3-dioxygenase-like lactoylglutathione lyase family enzyme